MQIATVHGLGKVGGRLEGRRLGRLFAADDVEPLLDLVEAARGAAAELRVNPPPTPTLSGDGTAVLSDATARAVQSVADVAIREAKPALSDSQLGVLGQLAAAASIETVKAIIADRTSALTRAFRAAAGRSTLRITGSRGFKLAAGGALAGLFLWWIVRRDD